MIQIVNSAKNLKRRFISVILFSFQKEKAGLSITQLLGIPLMPPPSYFIFKIVCKVAGFPQPAPVPSLVHTHLSLVPVDIFYNAKDGTTDWINPLLTGVNLSVQPLN